MSKFPEILFEDNHLIAVNKTVHDLVQKDKTRDTALDDLLRDYIGRKYQKPGNVFLGVIHRLDRPVSGVVLFARTSKALNRMNEKFRTREVQKTYWAIVKDLPPEPEARLVHYISRNRKQNKSICHNQPFADAREAILDYRVIAGSDNYHLLEIRLLTGRHHQIRAQLAAMGCPIRGDLKYGYSRSNPDGGISLHSRELSFIHPVKDEEITLVAPTPAGDKLWDYFSKQEHTR